MVDINLEVTKDEINAGIKKANALNGTAGEINASIKKINDLGGTASEINTILSNVSKKQDSLVSGTNIKTINNQSTLGSGNINIEGGSGGITLKDIEPYVDGQWVSCDFQIASSVTFPLTSNVTYDLSSLVPNDGYNYELMLYGQVNPTRTLGSYCNLLVSSSVNTSYVRVIASTCTNASYACSCSATVTMVIGTNRDLTVAARPNDKGNFNLACIAYKRLGKALSQ